VIADRETFTDLTVHLKRASDALLRTANHLAVLCRDDVEPDDRCAGALDELIAMAIEMAAMERILRALMDANHEEEAAAATGRR
jgi:adenine deaminase